MNNADPTPEKPPDQNRLAESPQQTKVPASTANASNVDVACDEEFSSCDEDGVALGRDWANKSSGKNTGAEKNTWNENSRNIETIASSSSEPQIEQLVDAHYAELYKYAYRLVGNGADAADITQQTFLNAQRNLGSLRDSTKARGWLYAILRNTFFKLRRKKNPTAAASLDLEVDSLPDPALQDKDDPLEFSAEELQAAVSSLPEEFRAVVLMFYFEEASYREIAQQLEIPEGTVMSRLSRAKGHLRKRLSRK